MTSSSWCHLPMADADTSENFKAGSLKIVAGGFMDHVSSIIRLLFGSRRFLPGPSRNGRTVDKRCCAGHCANAPVRQSHFEVPVIVDCPICARPCNLGEPIRNGHAQNADNGFQRSSPGIPFRTVASSLIVSGAAKKHLTSPPPAAHSSAATPTPEAGPIDGAAEWGSLFDGPISA
jgi:hypothetical protein